MGMLRLALALAVVMYHLGITQIGHVGLVSGRAAVFAFFTISGFYMAMVLKTKYTERALGPNFVKAFYISRFLRLYPLYAIVLVAFLCASAILGIRLPTDLQSPVHASIPSVLTGIAAWTSNLTLAFINVPSSTSQVLIGPAWSIGVELSFYALAPYVLRWRWPSQLLLSLAGLALMLVPYGTHAPLLFGFPFFMLGAVAYYMYERLSTSGSSITRTTLVAVSVVGLIALPIPKDMYIGKIGPNVENSVEGFAFAIIVACYVPYLQRYTAKLAWDNRIGRLSYPLYLVHMPVIEIFNKVGIMSPLAILATCVSLSLFLLQLETHLLDPLRARIREERANSPRATPAERIVV